MPKKTGAVEVILEKISNLAKGLKNEPQNEFQDAASKNIESQIITLCKIITEIEIPSSQKPRAKKLLLNILKNWKNTNEDDLQDFFDKVAIALKKQGLEHLIDREEDDPDKRKPRSAKEHLQHLLKKL